MPVECCLSQSIVNYRPVSVWTCHTSIYTDRQTQTHKDANITIHTYVNKHTHTQTHIKTQHTHATNHFFFFAIAKYSFSPVDQVIRWRSETPSTTKSIHTHTLVLLYTITINYRLSKHTHMQAHTHRHTLTANTKGLSIMVFTRT